MMPLPMHAMFTMPPDALSAATTRAHDRLSLVVKALERNLEIGIAGSWLRLFKAGDVVRTPSGYFEMDAPRLMCRVIRGGPHPSCHVYTESSLESQSDLWSWLQAQAALLSDECVSRIAAACEAQHLGSRGVVGIGRQKAHPQSNVFTLYANASKR